MQVSPIDLLHIDQSSYGGMTDSFMFTNVPKYNYNIIIIL